MKHTEPTGTMRKQLQNTPSQTATEEVHVRRECRIRHAAEDPAAKACGEVGYRDPTDIMQIRNTSNKGMGVVKRGFWGCFGWSSARKGFGLSLL